MALPAPNLDDRRFEDLVHDAKRIIQRNCPEWTDHNVSDPGVTMIETFAFMVDQLLYRLNRVPERLHIKFLDLIGVRLFPPTAARTEVTFWLSAPAQATLTIPTGTEAGTLRTETVDSVIFTTVADLDALPCERTEVRTRPAAAESSEDRTGQLAAGVAFAAFSEVPAVGDVLLIALDQPVPRCAVRLEIDSRIEGIGVDPDNPPLVWEAHNGEEWVPCGLLRDETGGLNAAGGVVLDVPADHAVSLIDGERGAWLRVRVVEPDEGQPGFSASPLIEGLEACTVGVTGEVVNAEVLYNETVGTAEGIAGQVFQLDSYPVLPGVAEPVVETSSEDGWQTWTRVEHFAGSSPEDRHFVLDGYTGEITFGPVVRLPEGGLRQYGAVPEHGALVRVAQYAVGGGADGNVGAGTITTLKSSIPFVSKVENARSAHGGVDAETLDQARDRGALTLRTRSRAVTAEDYEVLARQAVPEAARVRCITADDAGVPTGTVKVLVVPTVSTSGDQVSLGDLVPSPQLLTRLAEHLDRVRLIGTRVSVEPPRYRGVTVVARVLALPRAKASRVRADALKALGEYLSPLPGGGPDGRGWPFGRAVRAGEVHTVLQRVPGVDAVEDVRLFTANPVTGQRGTETSKIELEPNSLVFSFDHQVRVETR
ncbi:putative baseplate assembly protein [Amycolatopsis sp. cmx-4-61]|uniref:putative baseplate assembly protein n=1 Tax=Amycolatopsis sp. cmx-4-61 TaxID=2790937 RepID=UPI003979C969